MTTTLPYQHHSETSLAAAEYSQARARTDKARVLFVLTSAGVRGMTDEEIQHVAELHGSTERPRRIALCNEGKVIDSGKKRMTASGRMATVWEAV